MRYNDLSSWRQQDVICKQGVNDIDFNDTTPNMFIVQNTSSYTLYAGISKIPSDNNFEFAIGKNSTATMGRPIPTRKLYIYNPTNVEVSIKIFSVYDIFDMNILNNVQVSLEGAELQTDGIVKGFGSGVSLPQGNNKIGEVDITDEVINQITGKQDSMKNALSDYANKILNKDLVENVTNLKSLLNVLTDVGAGIAALAGQLLTVTSSTSVSGAVISEGANHSTFSTNNWWDYWKPDSKGCFKVADFGSSTECEVQAQASYSGTIEQKAAIVYFTLESYGADKVKLSCGNTTEGYTPREYILESINDPTNVKYVRSTEMLWSLCKYLFTIYPPTVTPELISGFRSVTFPTSKQAYTYEETSSQVYNQYSGALSNLQKQANVISEFNGIYEITDSVGVNINSPLTTESNPIKIYDHIEFINNMSDYDMTIKLYYSFGDYVELLLPAKDFISDINMPIYNIGIKADTSTFTDIKVSLYGGLY